LSCRAKEEEPTTGEAVMFAAVLIEDNFPFAFALIVGKLLGF
jgi:hypothetical protein